MAVVDRSVVSNWCDMEARAHRSIDRSARGTADTLGFGSAVSGYTQLVEQSVAGRRYRLRREPRSERRTLPSIHPEFCGADEGGGGRGEPVRAQHDALAVTRHHPMT